MECYRLSWPNSQDHKKDQLLDNKKFIIYWDNAIDKLSTLLPTYLLNLSVYSSIEDYKPDRSHLWESPMDTDIELSQCPPGGLGLYLQAKSSNRVGSEEQPFVEYCSCLLYTSPSPRDGLLPRMPSSA